MAKSITFVTVLRFLAALPRFVDLAEFLRAFPGALTAGLGLCSPGVCFSGATRIHRLRLHPRVLCDALEGALIGPGKHWSEGQLYRPASSTFGFGLGLWNIFSPSTVGNTLPH